MVLFPQTGRSSWLVITCKQVALCSERQILSAPEEESPPSTRKEPSLWSSVQFSSLQWLSHVWLFETPWTAALQASLSITNFWSLLKLMSIKSVMTPNHFILCPPFSSCLQYFPASGSFTVSQFFTSGGQSLGASASASVLPMNIQDWFPLAWTGLISLQFKGLSRVFSSTTVQKHQFFGTHFSL